MATRAVNLTRSILTTKQTLSLALSRSYTSLSLSTPPPFSTFSLFRLRPLFAAAASLSHASPSAASLRGFATRQTTSSLNDSSPNWSNRPPKETILLDGCDFEHWLVVMEKPEGDPTRDDIIDSYIKTLAQVVGRFVFFSVLSAYYLFVRVLISVLSAYYCFVYVFWFSMNNDEKENGTRVRLFFGLSLLAELQCLMLKETSQNLCLILFDYGCWIDVFYNFTPAMI